MSLVITELLEPFAQPLNSNVIFLKETDITVANDAWRIAADIDIRMYQDYLVKGSHMLQRARVQPMMSALMLLTESAKVIILGQ